MHKRTTRLLFLLAILTALASWSIAVAAADRDEQQATGKTTTLTGCLEKGESANEFYLSANDGKKYELRSDKVSLANHVGHKITVTGTSVAESEAQEKEEGEKNEAGENEAGNLQVTKVKMISNTCK